MMAFVVQPYNSKQLAAAYDISKKVFKSWMKKIEDEVGQQEGKMWNVKQVEIILEKFGTPKK